MWLSESRSGKTMPAVLQAQVADIAEGYRSTLVLNLITLCVSLVIIHLNNEASTVNLVWFGIALAVVSARAYCMNALTRRGALISAPRRACVFSPSALSRSAWSGPPCPGPCPHSIHWAATQPFS